MPLAVAGFLLNACTNHHADTNPDATNDSTKLAKEVFSIMNLVKENKIIPDSVIIALNAQHHQMKVLVMKELI